MCSLGFGYRGQAVNPWQGLLCHSAWPDDFHTIDFFGLSQYRKERSFVDADKIPELLKGFDALLEVSACNSSIDLSRSIAVLR